MTQKTKKSATERLSNLESTLVGTLQALGELDNDRNASNEAIRQLSSKVDVIVTLLSSGKEVSNTNIGNLMVENKAAELAVGTAQMVNNGILVANETVEENSFVVGREVLEDGSVINPRIQFTVESTMPHLKAKLLGAKVLDKITVEEGKAALEVLEIYSINQPQAPQAQPEASAQA
jgi:hypothetical protein